MLEEKYFSIGVVDVNNISNKPQAFIRDPLEPVSRVASSAGKTNTWKDEVDAIERALNCVGLGFQDEQMEKNDQVAKIEPKVKVLPDRAAFSQSNKNMKKLKTKK